MKAYSVDAIRDMLNQEAKKRAQEISDLRDQGFIFWHFGHRDIEPDEEFVILGTAVMWKPKGGEPCS